MEEKKEIKKVLEEGPVIKWLPEPKPHNYPAAESYLNLIFDPLNRSSGNIVYNLKQHPITKFKAKDIIRASGLPVLSKDNLHVMKNIKKISEGEELSPVLLVRDTVAHKVIIADGYHRVCTVYLLNEDADIPAKIA
jgi:disulfide oxidoreductase YuzD